MLKALGIDESDSAGSTKLNYGRNFGCQHYRLLEVDEGLLKEILDGRVCIKGASNEEAVLCSSSTTYAVKYVSTSNTVLLVAPDESDRPTETENGGYGGQHGGHGNATVVATIGGYVELVETAPRTEKLKILLTQNPYKEEQDNTETGHVVDGTLRDEDLGLYSWGYLSSNVQASDQELEGALKELGAVQIGKHWRTLEPQFMKGILEVLLLNAAYHDWPFDGLKASDVLPIMAADGFPEKLVRHCLAVYGIEMPGMQEETWLLDQSKICIQYARELLLDNPRWKSEQFLEEWQRRLPPAIRPTLEMLAGEALLETLGSQSWVRVFSRSSLPVKPADRFAALFKEQPRWLWEDLQHYVSDLRVPGLSIEAMLLKYTRKIQPDAASPPVYSAR